eukprot:gene347-15251_t
MLALLSASGWGVEAAGCTTGYSSCCNGKCIRTSYIQDGDNDCGDGSDESSPAFQCTTTTTLVPTSPSASAWKTDPRTGEKYWVNLLKLDWDDAETHCQAAGASLVKIDKELQASFLATLDVDPGTGAWIGCKDTTVGPMERFGYKEGTFVWTDGTPCPLPNACWDADTRLFPTCGGYADVGYTCVGSFCAAVDPGGHPRTCAVQRPSGWTVNTATGKCEEPSEANTEASSGGFSNWQDGEPNYQSYIDEDCVELEFGRTRGWDDRACNTKLVSICQYNQNYDATPTTTPPPLPTTTAAETATTRSKTTIKPQPTCEKWCAGHSAGWTTKCSWRIRCGTCPECFTTTSASTASTHQELAAYKTNALNKGVDPNDLVKKGEASTAVGETMSDGPEKKNKVGLAVGLSLTLVLAAAAAACWFFVFRQKCRDRKDKNARMQGEETELAEREAHRNTMSMEINPLVKRPNSNAANIVVNRAFTNSILSGSGDISSITIAANANAAVDSDYAQLNGSGSHAHAMYAEPRSNQLEHYETLKTKQDIQAGFEYMNVDDDPASNSKGGATVDAQDSHATHAKQNTEEVYYSSIYDAVYGATEEEIELYERVVGSTGSTPYDTVIVDPMSDLESTEEVDFRAAIESISRHFGDDLVPGGSALTCKKQLERARDQAEGFANQVRSRGVPESLTTKDVAVINLYTKPTQLYRRLNAALGGYDNAAGDENVRHFKPYIKLLVNALKKLPKQELTLYRGVKEPVGKLLGQTTVGTVVSFNQFMSATPNPGVLRDTNFLGEGAGHGERTVFQINGINAIDLKGCSLFDGERELVFLPGTQFIIEGFTAWDFGVTEVRMRELPPGNNGDDALPPPAAKADQIYEDINNYLSLKSTGKFWQQQHAMPRVGSSGGGTDSNVASTANKGREIMGHCVQKTSTGPCTNAALPNSSLCAAHTCGERQCNASKSSKAKFCASHTHAHAVAAASAAQRGKRQSRHMATTSPVPRRPAQAAASRRPTVVRNTVYNPDTSPVPRRPAQAAASRRPTVVRNTVYNPDTSPVTRRPAQAAASRRPTVVRNTVYNPDNAEIADVAMLEASSHVDRIAVGSSTDRRAADVDNDAFDSDNEIDL